MFCRDADGAGEADSIYVGDDEFTAGAWLPRGDSLVLISQSTETLYNLWLHGPGGGEPRPVLTSPFSEDFPAVSPDGKWLAYVTDESGRMEIYVRSLSGDGGRVQVSRDGGQEPAWSRDGRELFYIETGGGGSRMMAAAVTTQPTFRVTSRAPLFDARDYERAAPHANYDVGPDGRFVMVRRAAASEVVIVQNWHLDVEAAGERAHDWRCIEEYYEQPHPSPARRSLARGGTRFAPGLPMKSGVGLILAAVVGLAHGPTVDRSVDTLPTIRFNDNLEAAGRLESGVLTRLLGPEEPGAEVLGFAEQGETPQIPGPMIRAPLGTEIRVIVRNPLETPLVLHGLSARRVAAMDSVVVPGGEVREVRFTVDAVGTYYYWGTTTGASFRQRHYEDSPLSGALIVDPPGSSDPQRDRVFLMGLWIGGKDEEGNPDDGSTFLVINGRPWPLTERLTYDMGDSVRWRIINATQRVHPMHLHGFFYRVDARGDIARDSVYWPGQQRMAVTELMLPGTTMSLAWSPNRPGGWVFHCHLNWHVVANASLGADRETGEERFQHLLRGHHDGDPNNHVVEGMGGLMLGIFVRPPEGWVPHEPKRRELRLFVNSDSAAGDERPVFAYILQEGDAEPAPDSILIPGSPLVLWEGEPTSVTVINRTGEATQVHWHGLEIESYYDGVTGVGGYPGRLTPNILPGDSFEMRITPPRAGSYMYHTHVNDIRQQTAGLYPAAIQLPVVRRAAQRHNRAGTDDLSRRDGVPPEVHERHGAERPHPLPAGAG